MSIFHEPQARFDRSAANCEFRRLVPTPCGSNEVRTNLRPQRNRLLVTSSGIRHGLGQHPCCAAFPCPRASRPRTCALPSAGGVFLIPLATLPELPPEPLLTTPSRF